MPLNIGFTTNYNNLEIYKDEDVLQITLGDPSDPNYKDSYETYKNKPKIIHLHSKYTYNISKNNINHSIKKESDYLKSLNLKTESGIVIHLNKYYKKNRTEALIDVATKLNDLCYSYLNGSNIKIFLETSSNLDHLGSTISDFKIIFQNLNDLGLKHIFICLDTSHIFLSGKDITTKNGTINYLVDFEKHIGLEKIKLIHLNDIDSVIFGKHTPHLPINSGVIFEKNKKSLEFFLLLAKKYNIPIILERNKQQYTIEQIRKEILFLKKIKLSLNTESFYNIIKSLLFFNYLDALIIFYSITEDKDSDDNKLELLQELKNEAKNKLKYSNDTDILKQITNRDAYSTFHNGFNLFWNNYNYGLFETLANDEKYKTIQELMKVKFIGADTARKLFSLGFVTIEQIKNNIKQLTKAKVLSIPQINAIKAYKFLNKTNLNFDTVSKIESILKSNYSNFTFDIFGSYYRAKCIKDQLPSTSTSTSSDLTEDFFKDIDLMFVGYNQVYEFIDKIKQNDSFVYKGNLIDGLNRKMIVFNFKNKGKSNFFIFDIFICSEQEKVFMELFLTQEKTKNIIIRNVAKNKGYKLTERSLTKIEGTSDNNNLFFKDVKELFAFLNIHHHT